MSSFFLAILMTHLNAQQFTTANNWLPTKRGLGAVGTFAAPEFVFASAGFSSTGVDELNCITVTLISSVTIASPAADSITELTLSGLQAFNQPTSQELPLFVNRDLCLAGEEVGVKERKPHLIRPGSLMTGQQQMKVLNLRICRYKCNGFVVRWIRYHGKMGQGERGGCCCDRHRQLSRSRAGG